MSGNATGAATGAATIAFGTVRHTRLRPVRNAFCYPAYFLRLPLTRLGESLAGLRWCGHNRRGVLSFYDSDHVWPAADMASGVVATAQLTPLAWIRALLATQGIADADGEVWLHAFPRVLGYVFNPVTFWHCHRADGGLRAIVCAVQNTFGERHCYLLAHADGRAIARGELLHARKVFHVSPFCRIEGRYEFRFLAKDARSVARIDYLDDAGALLVTSIGGTHVPLDDRALRRAFFGHPLFTLGVVARIHWQALRLWLARVPFHSKPQPPREQVSR